MTAERFQAWRDMGTRNARRVLAAVAYVVTIVLAFYVTRVYFLFRRPTMPSCAQTRSESRRN